jgi:hypothetical protein
MAASSFYLALNSDGSKEIHPHNHGGDFTIELHKILDLHGLWEVALVEMSYFGQVFGNLIEPYNIIQLSSQRKNAYPKSFVLNYTQASNLSIKFSRNTQDGRWRLTNELKFPQRHYTWRNFKKTLSQSIIETSNHNDHGMHKLSLKINNDDNSLVISSTIHRTRMKVEFSEQMKKFLSIKEENVIIGFSGEDISTTIAIVKPEDIVDKTTLLFTPMTKGYIWFFINLSKIELPLMHWSLHQINDAIQCVIDENKYNFKLYYSSIEELIVEFAEEQNVSPTMAFSDLIGINDDEKERVIENSTSFKYYSFTIANPAEDVENDYESTFTLPFNYYPTPDSLIQSLNTSCKEYIHQLINQQHSEQEIVHEIFTIDDQEKCTFTPVGYFNIKISSYLLNVLSLSNTYEKNVGSSPVTLVSPIRPFLHVCGDIVSPHLLNSDEYPLLRIINNNASEHEKVMISFPSLHYYPVCRRYISKIRTFVTDHFSTDSLPFKYTVTYLLHFRQCHFT